MKSILSHHTTLSTTPKTKKRHTPSSQQSPQPPPPRRSKRGTSSLYHLAESITARKNILFITGAGVSVNSGIRPFRGTNGLWETIVWTHATREAFRKSPLNWYNTFWLRYFPTNRYDAELYRPNSAHEALAELTTLPNANIQIITQNVDGLHSSTNTEWDHGTKLIEAHGRVGLYKCIPEEDSDTDDSDDDEEEGEDGEEERCVKLGSRKKSSERMKALQEQKICRYEISDSIPTEDIRPLTVRDKLLQGSTTLSMPPLCPGCRKPCPPQALLFDEGYHSHMHYRFTDMERWLEDAEIIVFVGTSFKVSLTDIALMHCRRKGLEVYNFNLERLESTSRLNVENIVGDAEIMLVRLLSVCRSMLGL